AIEKNLSLPDLDNESQEIQLIINRIIEERKLGSAIFINTETYLSIILSQPCIQCKEIRIGQKKVQTTGSVFNLCITVKCKEYKTIAEYKNQDSSTDFMNCVSAASLIGGINHQSLQNILAIIGITNQSYKSTYYDHQIPLYKKIESCAQKSAKDTLIAVVNQLRTNQKKLFQLDLMLD
ncbi:14785_t:CDS:1, partial [Racocetra fulgida]